ncbi:PBAN-type neuropeptides-like [Homalodisca vitripennis]|uniref:PBAN-type neuropeptides-like n=1 Tax=Homalodisca vitripennis TaxID=197043 RepID=UPI001EE9BD14|nr:PBAN-type neuropeptides-like [Homalodisca vitripennis]KAG8252427.1 hypothetical protein J6590_057148 [Homalodisca vitripennis]
MDSLTSCVCVVLLVAVLTPSDVESYTDVYIDGTAVEEQPPKHPYLWFGPRLGRRKRTIDEAVLPKSPIFEEAVISVFDDTPWALMPLKNMQERALMGMSPRQEEEVPENSKAPPFAPRLGRRRKMLPFSPRLGRELSTEPLDRFERSVSDESNKTH